MRERKQKLVLSKVFNWCFLLRVSLALLIGLSLTRSDKISASIEPICDNPTPFTCRSFRCTVSSSEASDIQWFLKPCQDASCDYEHINVKNDNLQSSSNVTLSVHQFGSLKCIANNSKDEVKVFQDVAPIDAEKRSIILRENQFKYKILAQTREVDVYWHINVQGQPQPELYLVANNQTIHPPASPKYFYTVISNKIIFLKIKNVSREDMDTSFELWARNAHENVTLKLNFDIAQPVVSIEIDFLNSTYSRVKCRAVSLLETDVFWFFNPRMEGNYTYIPMVEVFKPQRTKFQLITYLDLTSSMTGSLKCSANNSINFTEVTQEVAAVEGGLDIFVSENNVDIEEDVNTKRIQVKTSILKPISLICAASAHNHSSKVRWAGENLNKDLETRVSYENTIFSNRATMQLPYDAVNLFCKTWRTNDHLEFRKIEITHEGTTEWRFIIMVVLLVAIVAVTSVFIAIKTRSYKKLQKKMDGLRKAGLDNFEKGAIKHLNPKLTIDVQADLLPYDKNYELPIGNIKLGEQIGSGAFGVLLKGEAKGVFEEKLNTVVAVKMANRHIPDVYLKALATELKIMIHLGKHLNIVNLLGAYTNNIIRRELFVIVEYCRFGNLKDHLINHRNFFIDQIDPKTGKIDFQIGDAPGANCSNLPPPKTYTRSPSFHKSGKTRRKSVSVQVDQSVRYKGDNDIVKKPVCTRDLLIWSFQVARGMEFLASRKVLHGDLAARNILLTDGNVVKICDFGLSRKLYQEDIFRKAEDEILSVKWKSLEAMTDKIYSVQSDVWSFGVALWEIFSLAETPYSEIDYRENFYDRLISGYRMQAPQFATDDIYEIMMRCWSAKPSDRPSFTDLVGELGAVLEDPVREHFIDMNSCYVKMNAQRFGEHNTDYLSMMSAPECNNFSSPLCYGHRVNSSRQNEIYTHL